FPQQTELSISQFVQYATANKDELNAKGEVDTAKRRSPFTKLTILDNRITGEFDPNAQGVTKAHKGQFYVKYPPGAITDRLIKFLTTNNPKTTIEYSDTSNFYVTLLINMLPWLFIILFIYVFFIRQMRASGGGPGMLGSFGRSRHRVSNKEL